MFVQTQHRVVRGALAVVAAAGLVASVAARRATPGVTYKLTITTEPPDMMRSNGMRNVVLRAHGVATATQQRIDLDAIEPNNTLLLPQDYFLMLDTGKTTQVSPQNSIYTDHFSLAGAVGIGAVLPMQQQDMSTLTVSRVQAKLDTIPGNDVISGHPTRHFRVTVDYAVAARGTEIPFHAVVEVWTAQLPLHLTNPFEQIALLDSAGPMQAIFDKMSEIRAQMGGGVALKTVTTTSIDISSMGVGGGGMAPLQIVQTSEFSDMKDADIDPAQFTIPKGFSKSG
ncbi:MAG TPA: hypothetical protein VMH39_12200 [Gemmatimonadaceae bacterium]|nr:hypothetical protein [Gemmatimonadaceae bacterium]